MGRGDRENRLLGKNWPMVLIVSLMLLIMATIGLIFHIKELGVERRLDLVKQINQAERDFSKGLMHITLGREQQQGPWQVNTGKVLLSQGLASYEAVAQSLIGEGKRLQLQTSVRRLTNLLLSDRSSNGKLGFDLRQNVFQLSRQADRLQTQLLVELDTKRGEQRIWFVLALVASALLLVLLLLALVYSERRRSLLHLNLKFSEQRFLRLLQNIDDVFWLENMNSHKLMYVSPAFEILVQNDSQRLIGKMDAWLPLVHPEDVSLMEEARAKAIQGPQDIECRFIRGDGNVRWVAGRFFPIWSDGENDPNAVPDYVALIFRDISEKRSLDQQLLQAQKMESLGQLTGGVAHDFNNLLTVIQSNAQLLVNQLGRDSNLARIAGMIVRASERGAGLNQQLLAFSSKQQLQPETLCLNAFVEEVVGMLSRTLGAHIRLSFSQQQADLWACVDPNQLQNVLVNLCINARDAMPEGGRVDISLAATHDENILGPSPNRVGRLALSS